MAEQHDLPRSACYRGSSFLADVTIPAGKKRGFDELNVVNEDRGERNLQKLPYSISAHVNCCHSCNESGACPMVCLKKEIVFYKLYCPNCMLTFSYVGRMSQNCMAVAFTSIHSKRGNQNEIGSYRKQE